MGIGGYVSRLILKIWLEFYTSTGLLFARTWALWNQNTRLAIALGAFYLTALSSVAIMCIFWQSTFVCMSCFYSFEIVFCLMMRVEVSVDADGNPTTRYHVAYAFDMHSALTSSFVDA